MNDLLGPDRKNIAKCIRICAGNHPPLTPPVEGGEMDLSSPLAGEGRERGTFIEVTQRNFQRTALCSWSRLKVIPVASLTQV